MTTVQGLGYCPAVAPDEVRARTPWHPLFAALIRERCPSGVEVQSEVVLSQEPQRADLLLIQRSGGQLQDGSVLRQLWPLLPRWALVEFKSAAAPPRAGTWMRLLGYGAQFHAPRAGEIGPSQALGLVLVVPRLNQALQEDAARLGLTYESLGSGYYRVAGLTYPAFLVVVERVSAAEHDPLLAAFAKRTIDAIADEARYWLAAHMLGKSEIEMANLEGYDEMLTELMQRTPLKYRLGGLSAKERLGGLSAKERLDGLSEHEHLLALPDEVLRGLSESYIESLPEEIRSEIISRLQH